MQAAHILRLSRNHLGSHRLCRCSTYLRARRRKEEGGGKPREISPHPMRLRNATIFPSSPLPLTIFRRPSAIAVLAIESRGSKAFAFQRFDLHSKHEDSTRKSESISALFRDPERDELNKESDVFISLIYKARWNGMEYIQVNGKWSELDFRISLASFFFFFALKCVLRSREIKYLHRYVNLSYLSIRINHVCNYLSTSKNRYPEF